MWKCGTEVKQVKLYIKVGTSTFLKVTIWGLNSTKYETNLVNL